MVQIKKAFTLIELLVVIAIIAILASLLLTAINNAKHKAYAIRCLSNHKELTLAWISFAHDNNDRVAIAGDRVGDGSQPTELSWCGGMMDFDGNNESNWNINKDIAKSPLYNYFGQNAKILRCPANRSVIIPSYGPFAGQIVPRVRSLAINLFIGGEDGTLQGTGPDFDGWFIYNRLNDFKNPGPSKTFLAVDQREDSVNTGSFGVSMYGYPNEFQLTRYYQDIPASYHLKATAISFVDGHVEIKRWIDPRTTFKVVKNYHLPLVIFPSPNNQDIRWLQERTTRKID